MFCSFFLLTTLYDIGNCEVWSGWRPEGAQNHLPASSRFISFRVIDVQICSDVFIVKYIWSGLAVWDLRVMGSLCKVWPYKNEYLRPGVGTKDSRTVLLLYRRLHSQTTAQGVLNSGLPGGGRGYNMKVSRNSTVLVPAYSLPKQEQLQLAQASFQEWNKTETTMKHNEAKESSERFYKLHISTSSVFPQPCRKGTSLANLWGRM